MTRIRRYLNKEYVYFLTHVTYDRRRILTDRFDLLWESTTHYVREQRATIIAWVVLPDHWHLLINLKDDRLPDLMRRIKLSFSTRLRGRMGVRTGRIWQYRYWDHVIRSQDDFNAHMDYIHYNPVKHGYVRRPFAWKYSSIHEYKNVYSDDWGVRDAIDIQGEFGD